MLGSPATVPTGPCRGSARHALGQAEFTWVRGAATRKSCRSPWSCWRHPLSLPAPPALDPRESLRTKGTSEGHPGVNWHAWIS